MTSRISGVTVTDDLFDLAKARKTLVDEAAFAAAHEEITKRAEELSKKDVEIVFSKTGKAVTGAVEARVSLQGGNVHIILDAIVDGNHMVSYNVANEEALEDMVANELSGLPDQEANARLSKFFGAFKGPFDVHNQATAAPWREILRVASPAVPGFK